MSNTQYILKNACANAGIHGKNDFMVLYDVDKTETTRDGWLYSSQDSFKGVLPYLLKYVQNGSMNTEKMTLGQMNKLIADRLASNKEKGVVQYVIIYVNGKKSSSGFGENYILFVDAEEFTERVGMCRDPLLIFANLMSNLF